MKKSLILFALFILVTSVALAQIDTISYNIYQQDGNLGVGAPPANTHFGIFVKLPNAVIKFEDTSPGSGDVYAITNNKNGIDVLNFAVYNKTDERTELSFDGEGNVIVKNGNFGVGTNEPNAKVHVTDGDVYISDINKGIIMKSPNGQCWRGTINNNGVLEFNATACPDGYVSVNSKSEINYNIEILPNPADNEIEIIIDYPEDPSYFIQIIDASSIILKSFEIQQSRTILEIDDLKNGLYIIRILDRNGDFIKSKKIIKN